MSVWGGEEGKTCVREIVIAYLSTLERYLNKKVVVLESTMRDRGWHTGLNNISVMNNFLTVQSVQEW